MPNEHHVDMLDEHLLPGYSQLSTRSRETIWDDVRFYHNRYTALVFAYWIVIVLIVAAFHSLNILSAARRNSHHSTKTSNNFTKSLGQQLWPRIRANVLLPATFGHHCQVPLGQFTVPPRIETIVIVVFLLLNSVLCCISYPLPRDSLIYKDRALLLTRFFADRTGYLSYANTTLSWLFGIRNNLLIQMTGMNFATFNRFHRWVARIAVLQAILHSLAYTAYSFMSGGWTHYLHEFTWQYWNAGVVATILMCFLLAASILWLRVRHYETFLALHIGLALIILIGLFLHTKIFNGKFDWFLWLCVGFWLFDRLMRCFRIFRGLWSARTMLARAEYSSAEDLIRIDVTDVLGGRQIPRECHFYLYHMNALYMWQSHPFSLVTWTGQDAAPINEANETSLARRTSAESDRAALLTQTESKTSYANDTLRYTLLVRPYDGYTRRLRESLVASSGQYGAMTMNVKVCLEGPYEGGARLDGCDQVLLVLGGSGVAAGISCIYKVLQSMPSTTIKVVWAVRTSPLIKSVLRRELGAALASERVTLEGYITRQDQVPRHGTFGEYCTFRLHRPDIAAVVQQAAHETSGDLGVVVCGPAQMTDDTRAAVVNELKAGRHHVQLFVESFNW